jgi:hypothetical protein
MLNETVQRNIEMFLGHGKAAMGSEKPFSESISRTEDLLGNQTLVLVQEAA